MRGAKKAVRSSIGTRMNGAVKLRPKNRPQVDHPRISTTAQYFKPHSAAARCDAGDSYGWFQSRRDRELPAGALR